MAEFLAENNICGQTLLHIVATGNAIIPELLRLKDYIPEVFRLESKKTATQKYGDIIVDFKYFKISEAHDHKIENDPKLSELDSELRESYIDILTRFYQAFESILQYSTDLNMFVKMVNDGTSYIQQSIESILQDEEGKQLLCESLYLFGLMLLVVDLYIPGLVRERLLVSFYRYNSKQAHGIDLVCKLLRSTGFINGQKRPEKYPENYFARVPLDETFVEMVLGRFRAVDIYNQILIYPLPEHRTTALANQAGMVVVCLFFSPNTINTQPSRMREISDKFFADNWIVNVYMGITVNLIDLWEPYKAAKAALNNTVDAMVIREHGVKHCSQLAKLLKQTKDLLNEGVLTDVYVMRNITKIISVVRECNVTLRWLMLQTTNSVIDFGQNKRCKTVRDMAIAESQMNPIEIFSLLLNASQLELKVKDILRNLFDEKESKWAEYRSESATRIKDLVSVFSGEKIFMKVEENKNLKPWFEHIHAEVMNLDLNNATVTGRKIVQLIQALETVQEFHNLDANAQVCQHLTEIREYLHKMIYHLNITEEILINVQLIGDLSYAWRLIDDYTAVMQEHIKKSPSLVIKLRAVFMKMASALEIPLLRINQAKSDDLASVSQYFSNELADYVRKVLQVIPKTIFEILTEVIHLQTNVIQELPTRLPKTSLKDFAQLDNRYVVSRLTYQLSVFTEGVLMMKKTLVGVIELDPKRMLEDGIRKELVKKLAESLDECLVFSSKLTAGELVKKLAEVERIIDGFRRSFEYVQDYLNIPTVRFFHEEMLRIININVERECNVFKRNKVLDWQSLYQSSLAPIPQFKPKDDRSITFIGRLAREILRQTSPKTTTYVSLQMAWYDQKTGSEVVDKDLFAKIIQSGTPSTLVGLDKFYALNIVVEMEKLVNCLEKNIIKEKQWTETLDEAQIFFEDLDTTPLNNPKKTLNDLLGKCSKIWPTILEWVLSIGQLQILRKHIAYELNVNCSFNSRQIETSVKTLNESILLDMKAHQLDKSKPKPSQDLMYDLNKLLEEAGLYDPYHTIYVTSKNSSHFGLFFFLFVVSHVPKFTFNLNTRSLAPKKINEVDGMPFVVGIISIMRQFNSEVMVMFVECLCRYLSAQLESSLKIKQEIAVESTIVIRFLETFVDTARIPRATLEKHLSPVILNHYEFLVKTTA